MPEIISLAKRGLFWAVLYGLFTRGSQGGCVTGTDAAATCYTATLDPSPVVWLAMAVVFVISLSRASRATETTVVTRVLRRAATAMWVLPLLAAVDRPRGLLRRRSGRLGAHHAASERQRRDHHGMT